MMNDPEWVERRLALLDPAEGLTRDPARAFTKLRARERRFHSVRRNRIWAIAMAAVACAVLVVVPTWNVCCARPVEPQAPSGYKETGSRAAPLVCEIYTDFECPACARFYNETYPQLEAAYVKTGKVRILHRDLPLQQHHFALQAAHYADAAGELGQYDVVFRRLFQTQNEWSANGNIEGALKPVLPAGVMLKLNERSADPEIDRSIALDREKAVQDHLTQTPTLVIVTPDGKRHKLEGVPPFNVLSSYLDELLSVRKPAGSLP